MPIPSGITRDHVLDAMSRIGVDPATWPHQSQSTEYDVIDPRNGARLPPKLVSSTAAQIATGRQLPRRTFHGGPETNERLSELGFSILPKSAESSNQDTTKLPNVQSLMHTPHDTVQPATPDCLSLVHKLGIQHVDHKEERPDFVAFLHVALHPPGSTNHTADLDEYFLIDLPLGDAWGKHRQAACAATTAHESRHPPAPKPRLKGW
jgi:hypothetical protein